MRALGVGILTSRPSKRICPESILLDPGQDLDQRGLARAVLANQRVHFPVGNCEAHVASER